MCVIVLNKKTQLTKDQLYNCWTSNGDGTGICWTDGQTLKMKKFDTDTPFQKILEYYEDIRPKTEFPILLHFRIATHGSVSLKNTHPFMVNQNLAMAHNGVLTGFGSKTYNNEVSDTIDFMKKVLRKFPSSFYKHQGTVEAIGTLIGTNKFAFLDNTGYSLVINENLGYNEGDTWFSNTSYRSKGYRKGGTASSGNSKSYGGGYCGYSEYYEGDDDDRSYSRINDKSKNNAGSSCNSNSGHTAKPLTKWVIDPDTNLLLTPSEFLKKKQKLLSTPEVTVEQDKKEDVLVETEEIASKKEMLPLGDLWTLEDMEWWNHIYNNTERPNCVRQGSLEEIGEQLIAKLTKVHEYLKTVETDDAMKAQISAFLDMIEDASQNAQDSQLLDIIALTSGISRKELLDGTDDLFATLDSEAEILADGNYDITEESFNVPPPTDAGTTYESINNAIKELNNEIEQAENRHFAKE